jgi:predicted ATPase
MLLGAKAGGMAAEDRRPFGSLLKRHRLAAGLTHEGLAERATVSVRAISDLERGVSRRPHPETVARLADALRLTPRQREEFAAASRPWVAPAGVAPVSGNLPVQLTSFVGREREVADLRAFLRRQDVRLVTLTGAGGSGKTRLAVRAVSEPIEQFEDGVVSVPLAPVAGPDSVGPAIARALGAPAEDGGSLASLVELLGGRRVLLLLDNFEHLLDAAPLVGDLLRGCPRLKALVTSRAALRISGEQEFPLAPLAPPDVARLPPVEALAVNPAVALFVDRATRVRPDFALNPGNAAAVAALCSRLDGLPLAIELAAARMKVLSPAALLELLSRGPAGAPLRALGGGARDLPARQRTMHETIAWSYNLLSAPEQRLLRTLAVFSNGCALDAVAAVHASESSSELLDGLAALVDHSLVYQTAGPDGEPRYQTLETIREFALEQLILHGEEAETRRRHAAWYLALVESTGALLFAGSAKRARAATEQDNIQAALRWLVQHG